MREFVRRGYEGGDHIPNTQIVVIALEIGLEGVDLDAALIFAGEQGWIEAGQPGFTIFTEAGYRAGGGT
jgi:hypothetical protein